MLSNGTLIGAIIFYHAEFNQPKNIGKSLNLIYSHKKHLLKCIDEAVNLQRAKIGGRLINFQWNKVIPGL